MKANELRIGNWIEYFGNNFLVKGMRRENSSWYISAAEKMNDLLLIYNVEDAFDPIPLTPEILEKCGFEKKEMWIILKCGEYDLRYIVNPELLQPLVLQYDRERSPLFHIKYLHQLQNLYFALTGEELQINL